jgi:hypothetical protein
MNPVDFNFSFNRAVHAFVLCLGALLGPFFIAAGVMFNENKNLILGVVMVGYLIYNLVKFAPIRNVIPKTDKIAFLIAPSIFLVPGLLFAFIGTKA